MDIKSSRSGAPPSDAALIQSSSSGKVEKGPEAQPRKVEHASQHKTSYNVSLSSDAKDLNEAYQKAYEVALSTPDVREDKVRELQAKIRNGTYKVDSGKVADGILREALKEKLATSE